MAMYYFFLAVAVQDNVQSTFCSVLPYDYNNYILTYNFRYLKRSYMIKYNNTADNNH